MASGVKRPEEFLGASPGLPLALIPTYAAIYVRVSSHAQDQKSQLPDLEHWAKSQSLPVRWFTDKLTGRTMNRPGWNQIEDAMLTGLIHSVVVWRLDRLGRTAAGLTKLFDELRNRKINLVSLKDGIDLETAAGRLMANVIASVAQYDNEIRSERVRSGQAVARCNGKTWGGSKPGIPKKLTPIHVTTIVDFKSKGMKIAAIARALNLSRPTIYKVLKQTT